MEEADESAFWMEIFIESGIVPKQELELLLDEAYQILKITSASRKTVSKTNNAVNK